MKIILLGPPGAGKGTVAATLSQHSALVHISTGDIFRSHIRGKTSLGLQVQSILDSGGLVPDELTTSLVRERLSQPDVSGGYILDGFPRTIAQAESLKEFAAINWVCYLSLSEDSIVERLSGRRVHPQSGRVYHVRYNPPQVAGQDDETGEPLIIRPDDQEEAIRNRLATYHATTAPLIDLYTAENLLVTIDASQPPQEVFNAIVAKISL